MPTQRGSASEIDGSGRNGGDLSTMESWEERQYHVEFTDASATGMDARNATGVPVWGSQLPNYSLYVMAKEAERDPAGPYLWKVTVTWRTLKPNDKQPKFNATHSTWSIVKTITGVPFQRPIEKDLNGVAMVNCIGEPYSPPVQKLEYDSKITINFLTNATGYNYALHDCKGSLNGSAYTITIGGMPYLIDALTLKLDNFVVGDQYDQDGTKIGSVSLELLYHAGTDGWLEKMPNRSFNHSVNGYEKGQPIMNGTGPNAQPISEPMYLDASGHELTSGAAIVTKNYTVLGSANFDQLFLVGQTPNLLA